MSEFGLDVVAVVISGLALSTSGFAIWFGLRQAKAAEKSADAADTSAAAAVKSADLAEVVERGGHFGWRIELGPEGRGSFVIRNIGSIGATNVQITGQYSRIELGEGPAEIAIGAGQALLFSAWQAYGDRGGELHIIWTPAAGPRKNDRLSWTEVPPRHPDPS